MRIAAGLFLLSMVMISWIGFQFDEVYSPPHFPKPAYPFEENPLTRDGIQLGRALFYDNMLSVNNMVSCASCHSVYNAFAHTDHALSHGIDDRIGKRNAPALMNLAWQKRFMWDGAIHHLDMQALAPISHRDEMGSSIAEVTKKLQASKVYPPLFEVAWGSPEVTGERVLKSLSQFMLTLVSAGSKYDRVKLQQAQFTEQEARGYEIFKAHCNSCHTEPLFTSNEFKNNGLPVNQALNDMGRYGITQNIDDSLCFKVPTLRNLKYTYPYMHDGRFETLSEVLRHYTGNLRNTAKQDAKLSEGFPLGGNAKVDLTAFLLTLSDSAFVFNPNLAFPREILLNNH
jgi:cytochrome c peroxidase